MTTRRRAANLRELEESMRRAAKIAGASERRYPLDDPGDQKTDAKKKLRKALERKTR